MKASRALQIELELQKEIPEEFYVFPAAQEDGKDRAAYDAMKAMQRYRRHLLEEELHSHDDLDCDHGICEICGAHLDAGEACDCRQDNV